MSTPANRSVVLRMGAGRLALAFLGSLGIAAATQSQTSPQESPAAGVVPLPQGLPATGMQAPVPAPAQPVPAALGPLAASPNLAAVKGFAESHPITIREAVSIALYTNRSLATALSNLEAASARTGEARSQLNPTLGVNSQLNYYDRANTVSLGNGPAFTIIPQFNPINTASFTLPIDIAGALRAAVSQAQFNEIAARIDVNRVRNQLVFDVKAAFYSVLRAQAQLAVATDNVNQSLQRLSDANKNFAAGEAPYYDVMTSRRDVANSQQALLVVQGQVSNALAALKNTMGLDIATRLSISSSGAVEYPNGVQPQVPSSTPPVSSPEPKTAPEAKYNPLAAPRLDVVGDPMPLGSDYQALVEEALRSRPDILEADAEIAAAKRGVQYARRSSLPSLGLSLSFVHTPDAAGFTRKNEGLATLSVSIPIFDGDLAASRVKEAAASVASAIVTRRTAEDQVKLDVQQAYIALVQARQRVAVSNVEVAQAEEAYRLARLRYNAGVTEQISASPELELINSQTSLTQAHTDQVNALYDYNSARAQLDRATGRYSYGPGPGYSAPPRPAQ